MTRGRRVARRETGWWRTGRRGTGTGSGPLGDLIEVFQPSRRHVVEEQERRRDDVQVPGSGAPPLVDLDAGTVLLPGVPPPPAGFVPADGPEGPSPDDAGDDAGDMGPAPDPQA